MNPGDPDIVFARPGWYFCNHCETIFEVPEGKKIVAECFRNLPPSAHLAVYAVDPEVKFTDRINWNELIANSPHQCKHGKPI